MAVLKNPKHEFFCQELAKGQTAEAAYTKAGYAPSLNNAQRLKSNEGVRSRVEGLVTRAAEKAADAMAIDKLWIMTRLKENAEWPLQAAAPPILSLRQSVIR